MLNRESKASELVKWFDKMFPEQKEIQQLIDSSFIATKVKFEDIISQTTFKAYAAGYCAARKELLVLIRKKDKKSKHMLKVLLKNF